MADNVQLYKYAVQMVTHSFGKTATFMPKPVKGDNGSGMHCHQSIWKGSTPVFMGKEYAGLSKLHFIILVESLNMLKQLMLLLTQQLIVTKD